MNLRRRWLWALGCLGWIGATRVSAQHVLERELLQPYVGTARLQRDRVKLELPRLADNGFTVPLRVSVANTAHSSLAVRRLLLLSNRNPRPLIAAFEFGETAPAPVISTRVRLGGSQTVFALVEMSDGSWWMDTADVEVTESACLDQT
jgi:sulfur-oxidizing protein SoxY